MSDERQAFEQLHAIPSGAIWCEKRHIYIHKNYSGLVLHPINESWEAFCEGALWQASRQALEGEAVDVERIADTVRDHLGGIFDCTRVWSAWQVGTMTEDDFTPAGETELADEIATAVAEIYTHPASSDEWIKCSERLPPEADHYLVALSDPEDVGWVTDKAWTAFYNKCGEWDCCEAVEDGQPVTHWMPLPAPPQEQGQ